MERICVITGGTSGIGKCTAEAMVKKGYTVYELSRRESGNPGMYHIPTDVTDPEAFRAQSSLRPSSRRSVSWT